MRISARETPWRLYLISGWKSALVPSKQRYSDGDSHCSQAFSNACMKCEERRPPTPNMAEVAPSHNFFLRIFVPEWYMVAHFSKFTVTGVLTEKAQIRLH